MKELEEQLVYMMSIAVSASQQFLILFIVLSASQDIAISFITLSLANNLMTIWWPMIIFTFSAFKQYYS